ncbi:MAG TPA: signal recognition particle-docking protein FtsY [Actinomycetota bacterium]|nr:signal recognition particle-docking protein FtsY [Actinomycetota bacterium]
MDLVVILVIAGAVLTLVAIALLVGRRSAPPPPVKEKPEAAAPPAPKPPAPAPEAPPKRVEIERVPAEIPPDAAPPEAAPPAEDRATETPAAAAGEPPAAPEKAAEQAPARDAVVTPKVEEPVTPPPTSPTSPAPPAPVAVSPPPAQVEEEAVLDVSPPPALEVSPDRLSGMSRLARGLLRTRSVLAQKLGGFARREKLSDEDWEEIEEALIRADVGVSATLAVVQTVRDSGAAPSELTARLKEELVAILQKGNPRLRVLEGKTSVWLVTGVNGVGKTTSIAKLANRLRQEGLSVVLAAADTFRAAAIDQLGTWADRAGVHMVRHAPGADPGAVVYDAIEHAKAKQIDVVIVDTAGRLHTKSNLMDELKKVKRIAERQAGQLAEVLLVIDATVGQNGIAQARTFQDAIEVTGVVLTKLDGTARGGIVVAVQEELGIPVKAVGVGETMDDLEAFDPEQFADALLG